MGTRIFEQEQTTTIHKVLTKALQLPAPAEKAIITHEDEKIAVILLLAGGFMVWYMFDEQKRSHVTYVIIYVPMNPLQFCVPVVHKKSHATYVIVL